MYSIAEHCTQIAENCAQIAENVTQISVKMQLNALIAENVQLEHRKSAANVAFVIRDVENWGLSLSCIRTAEIHYCI